MFSSTISKNKVVLQQLVAATSTMSPTSIMVLEYGHGYSRRSFAAAAAGSSTAPSGQPPLVKTALYDFHKEIGADMVPFAGYELPVLYKGENGGVMKEHLWCRSIGKSSLFDVSHMGQIKWYGKDRVEFLEKLVVGDIGNLKAGESCLSLVTNENGGILDDTVITNAGEYIYMVVNGATKFTDMEHFRTQMTMFPGDVTMEYLEDSMQLLAIQGPGAAQAVSTLLGSSSTINLTKMPFMTGCTTTIDGIDGCRITRCGYTGEDGFEIAIPAEHTVSIASKLVHNDPTVNPTGLGARDSLRLEAGLCLYGNDLNETTTPIEGALGWTLGPPGSRRRIEQGFLGATKILKPDGKFQPVTRKRIGLIGMKAPARQHAEVYTFSENDEEPKKIGEVTSGTYSPCLKVPIAMGYVETDSSKIGTKVQIKIRDKMQVATVTKMPFVETRYYRVPE